MTLGERLKRTRLAQNMSLSALARASGLSKGFLSQVETGATNPSLGSLHRLAQSLSISLSDLLATETTRPHPRGVLRPRLVRRVQPERGRSSLTQVGSKTQGAVYLAHLLPGSTLEATESPKGEDAYLMVLSGEVQFRQPGTSLRLAEGDSLTFPLGPHYRLTVQPPLRASLLLLVGSATDLPVVVEASSREQVPVQYVAGPARIESRGPLRLVAMRAARTAERGR